MNTSRYWSRIPLLNPGRVQTGPVRISGPLCVSGSIHVPKDLKVFILSRKVSEDTCRVRGRKKNSKTNRISNEVDNRWQSPSVLKFVDDINKRCLWRFFSINWNPLKTGSGLFLFGTLTTEGLLVVYLIHY